MSIKLLDIDRQIWNEELADFIPNTIFDTHTHLYKWSHTTSPHQEPKAWQEIFGKTFPNVNWKLLNTVDELLFPGRKVHRLTAGMPFIHCDFEAANRYTASEVSQDPKSGALMLVHPSMSTEQIETAIKKYGFIGFKPYRFYSVTGDPVECKIFISLSASISQENLDRVAFQKMTGNYNRE